MAVAAALACAVVAAPAPCAANDALQPWDGVGENLAGIWGWPYVMYTVSAFALTPPLVYTLDDPVQVRLQEDDPISDPFGETANIVGGLMPVALPVVLYGVGTAAGNPEIVSAASAALQALVVQYLAVSTLKWLADRTAPYPDGDPAQSANDFDFNAFEFDRGLWPSGHTASNFAMVSSLVAFFPDEPWLPAIGYPFALAVGLGMIEGDYHWLSDVVAGGLLGHAIGWVIGSNFRKRYDARYDPFIARAESGLQLLPGPQGLRLAYSF